MSRDSILGWILTVLVVISLFLSFSIWSQVPGNFSAFKISHDDNKVDPIQTVGPDKILVYFGNSFSTLLKPSAPLFEKSWSIARELLRAGSNLARSRLEISPGKIISAQRAWKCFSHTTSG